jgi:hypothetical protein
MARREARPPAEREVRLTPRRMHCVNCQQRLWVAYHAQRTLVTFRGVVRLTLVVRRCRNQECDLYHLPYRAEEEGAWALPHGEFGLDIITVVGKPALRGAPLDPRDPSTPGEPWGEHRTPHCHGSAGTLRASW